MASVIKVGVAATVSGVVAYKCAKTFAQEAERLAAQREKEAQVRQPPSPLHAY